MIAGVIRLGSRVTRSIMTSRQDVGWLDVNATNEGIRQTLTEHAEYGAWELARVRVYLGGARRVLLRRKAVAL